MSVCIVSLVEKIFARIFFGGKGTYVPVLECLVTGPHIRTVPSSLDEAIIVGSLGFQLTQFTVLVCPLRTATGFSRFECQMYTLLSENTVQNCWMQ